VLSFVLLLGKSSSLLQDMYAELLFRKPLGNPPAPSNLALAVVLLIVIAIQAIFNAWQGNVVLLVLGFQSS
jgi:sodium/potassium-transporting ATPase subunit alpha